MRPAAVVATLSAIQDRGAGTDAERRAAEALARQLDRAGLTVTVEPFWCRPNWALAHAWHAALALVGGLVAVASPKVGASLLLVALASLIADELTGRSLGRRLTPERASQNVLARGEQSRGEVKLIIAAHLNHERRGLVHRPWITAPRKRAQDAAHGRLPGWLAWLALATAWLLVCALLRSGGAHGTAVGALQLLPTVGLVLALALLIDLGTAGYARGGDDAPAGYARGGDDAPAVAAALTTALTVAPPAGLDAELLLAGAGTIGVRHHLRARRPKLTAPGTVVLGIAQAEPGPIRWWTSDGPFVPLRYLPALQAICARVADEQPGLPAGPHRGRGRTPALPARAAGLPAIAIGNAPDRPDAADDLVSFALIAVDGIDAYLRERRAQSAGARASATPA